MRDALIVHLREGETGESAVRRAFAFADTLPERLAQLAVMKRHMDTFRPLPVAVVAELEYRFAVRLTYHSNAIEGNTLTQSETETVLAHGITIGGKTLREHLEVVGHAEAITFVETLTVADEPVTERDIKNIHALILRDIDRTDAGRYRALDMKAAGTNHTYPPHYRVGEQMTAFIAWWHDTEPNAAHPVAFAAEAHYRFVSIHPFKDGNGCTGRLLMNLALIRAGYPVAVLPTEKRTRYIDALVAAQTGSGDLTALTGLVAESAHESLAEYLAILATATDARDDEATAPFYETLLAAIEKQETL